MSNDYSKSSSAKVSSEKKPDQMRKKESEQPASPSAAHDRVGRLRQRSRSDSFSLRAKRLVRRVSSQTYDKFNLLKSLPFLLLVLLLLRDLTLHGIHGSNGRFISLTDSLATCVAVRSRKPVNEKHEGLLSKFRFSKHKMIRAIYIWIASFVTKNIAGILVSLSLGTTPVLFHSMRHYLSFLMALVLVNNLPYDVVYTRLNFVTNYQMLFAVCKSLYKLRKSIYVVQYACNSSIDLLTVITIGTIAVELNSAMRTGENYLTSWNINKSIKYLPMGILNKIFNWQTLLSCCSTCVLYFGICHCRSTYLTMALKLLAFFILLIRYLSPFINKSFEARLNSLQQEYDSDDTDNKNKLILLSRKYKSMECDDIHKTIDKVTKHTLSDRTSQLLERYLVLTIQFIQNAKNTISHFFKFCVYQIIQKIFEFNGLHVQHYDETKINAFHELRLGVSDDDLSKYIVRDVHSDLKLVSFQSIHMAIAKMVVFILLSSIISFHLIFQVNYLTAIQVMFGIAPFVVSSLMRDRTMYYYVYFSFYLGLLCFELLVLSHFQVFIVKRRYQLLKVLFFIWCSTFDNYFLISDVYCPFLVCNVKKIVDTQNKKID